MLTLITLSVFRCITVIMKFSYYSGRIDEHMGGGEGRRGAPHVPPIKIFEKLPHKNAIKHDPPMIFSQPQVPPQKNLPKNHKDPPWISNYCASMLVSLT